MSDRDELAHLIHNTACDCKDRGYGLMLRQRDVEDIADAILAAGYRRVSTDPDTVERVGQAVFDEIKKYPVPSEPFRAGQVGSMGATIYDVGRAAIHAIGGGDGS